MVVEEPNADWPQGLALLRTLRAAAGNINEIAWSPSGAELASGDPDGCIGIWDIASGEQRLRLERGEKLVWSIAWSPNGECLASGTNEGTVRIYQTATGECLETLGSHGNWVRSVAWSPAGNWIASGANDKKVMIWDFERGERLHVFEGHRDRVLSVRFSPDGKMLASAGGDGDVVVWQIESREPIARYHFKSGWQRSVCFSPDGKLVAAGGEDGAVRLLRIADNRLAGVLEGHREGVGCVTFDASGQLLASRSVDGRIRLWSPSRGHWRLLARIKTSASFPMANLSFHPSEPTLAAVDLGRIRLWQISADTLRHAADGLPTTPIRTAKWLLVGQRTTEILTALEAQPLELPLGLELPKPNWLDKDPPRSAPLPSIYKLGDSPNRKQQQRELILWDLGDPALLQGLDLALFGGDAAGILVGLGSTEAEAAAADQLGALVESLGRLTSPAPPWIVVGDPSPAAILSWPSWLSRQPALKALLPLAWLHRSREGLLELTENESGPVQAGPAAILQEVEQRLDEELAQGRFVITFDDLLRQWWGREGGSAEEQQRRQLDAALRQLELRGRLRRLRPGPLVVARGITELYAGAFCAMASHDPRGLGAIEENAALDGQLDLPEKLRLEGQLDDLLRLGVLRELERTGLAFRAPLEGITHYFFPRFFGQGRQELPPTNEKLLAERPIEGDLPWALATLAVRLADGHAFVRDQIYANGAGFSSPLGGRFSVMLKVRDSLQTPRRGHLELRGEGTEAVEKLFLESALAELEKWTSCKVQAAASEAGLSLAGPTAPAEA